MRSRPPEPKGKLDAMTGYSFSTPVWDGGTWVTPEVTTVTMTTPARTANGPEDQPRDAPVQWDRVDWRAQEEQVRRLRQRIFTAVQEQDWPRVRNLQELMLRSRANTLVSVRQVTQRNTGRKTAGIDGEVALTPEARAAIFITCAGPRAKRVWALDADLAAAFDKIGHSFLLSRLGSFPAREMIARWLKAGVFEAGKGFAPTEEGTPQGGPISPCLLNVALHGLEEAAGVRYRTSGTRAGEVMPGSPVAVRYADDGAPRTRLEVAM